MELAGYLKILRRRWITIVVLCLIGLLAASALSLWMKPVYSSQTQLFVATRSSGTVSELQQGNTFSQARVQSYLRTAGTPLVLQPVVDALGLQVTPQELADKIETSADLNTVIITIRAEDGSPVQAAAIAQAVGESLVARVEELEKPSPAEASPVRLSVVTPATTPEHPTSPNVALNLLIGGILGLAGGVALAVLRTILDTKIRSEADVAAVIDAPTLGGITFDGSVAKTPLLTQMDRQSARAESFRQIRTNLQFARINSDSNTILVTSSIPGEGKSTTATNMAISLAQTGKTVALIDADLRRPMVAEYLGLEQSAGLTTALIGEALVTDLLQPWGENELMVLTSGRIPPNPSELLGSASMKQLIDNLASQFDMVIIDAPPLLPVTDAAILSQVVGGVAIVVGTSKVHIPEFEKAVASLQMVDAHLFGIIFNLLPTKGPDSYSHSYYSYASSPDKSAKKSEFGATSAADKPLVAENKR